jgi:glycogen operon protein
VDGIKVPSQSLKRTHSFARNLIRFRRAHPAFHKIGWWGGNDRDGDGFGMSQWRSPAGGDAAGDGASFGLRLDASREDLEMSRKEWSQYPLRGQDLFVAINGHHEKVTFQLPKNSSGKKWYRVMDTAAWAEEHGNYWPRSQQEVMDEASYGVNGRSLVVFLER